MNTMPLEDTETPEGELKLDVVPIPSVQDAAPDPARVLTNATTSTYTRHKYMLLVKNIDL